MDHRWSVLGAGRVQFKKPLIYICPFIISYLANFSDKTVAFSTYKETFARIIRGLLLQSKLSTIDNTYKQVLSYIYGLKMCYLSYSIVHDVDSATL